VKIIANSFYLTVLVSSLLFCACSPSPLYHSGRNGNNSARTVKGKKPTPDYSPSSYKDNTVYRKGQVIKGESSYYGPHFHGKQTANGETFNMNDLTCAHKSLPFNSVLRVTLLSTGKSVEVRVNDRGPYKKQRILDLSKEAARRIGMLEQGTGYVSIKILKLGEK